MATTLSSPVEVPTVQRLLTAADLAALPEDLPSGKINYELHDGRLIIMAPPGGEHGSVQFDLCYELKRLGELAGHGQGFADSEVILSRYPDSVVAPDVCFISRSRLPAVYSNEGFLQTIPDLVVEVRSKNDSKQAMLANAQIYLSAGVTLVWLLDPTERNVVVLCSEGSNQKLGQTDDLTAEGGIPDFGLPVSRLFAKLRS